MTGGRTLDTHLALRDARKKQLAWLQKISQRHKELLPEHLIGFEITNRKRFLAVYPYSGVRTYCVLFFRRADVACRFSE